MRSFSFLPVLATLAFSVFTSAAPSPVPADLVHANVDAKVLREVQYAGDLERRCVPCESGHFKDFLAKVEVEVTALQTVEIDINVTAEVSVRLNNLINIIVDEIAFIKANASVLVGFVLADVIALLSTLLALIATVVTIVLAALKVVVAGDVVILKGLLDKLLCAVGDLLCVILAIVGGLLGDVLTIVAEILAGVVASLGDISLCFGLFADLAAHWPQACGGSISLNVLVKVVIGLIGNVFLALGINISL